MNKLFILLFILIFIIFYTYINLDKLIHERKVHPILLNFFNHPLKESYKYSCDIEYKKKNNLLFNNSGFDRISPLIDPPNKFYNPNHLLNEINDIIKHKNDKRLGDKLANIGQKKSWQLRLFNEETLYSKFAPKCIDFIDKIAKDMNSHAISISLGLMYPKTWLKYHEGFWGYSEYITRCMIGIKCSNTGCALHEYNKKPYTIQEGKVITFNDCNMHEAWNITNQKRIVLIFDLWNNEGFDNNKNAIKQIKENVLNRKILCNEDFKRKETSLKTLITVKKLLK